MFWEIEIREANAQVLMRRKGTHRWHGAAAPGEAEVGQGHEAAAGSASLALVAAVAHLGGGGGGVRLRRVGLRTGGGSRIRTTLLDGERRLHGDAALTVRLVLVHLQLDVAVVSPVRAPRVLHYPEVRAVLMAITDNEYAVVEVGAAVVVEHAVLVELERALIGLDSNANGLHGDSLLQGQLTVLGHILVVVNRNNATMLLQCMLVSKRANIC